MLHDLPSMILTDLTSWSNVTLLDVSFILNVKRLPYSEDRPQATRGLPLCPGHHILDH